MIYCDNIYCHRNSVFDNLQNIDNSHCNKDIWAFAYKEHERALNLITKERYFHKPTIITMRHALEKMKQICLENNIKKIAMPVIGCGLDRLNWNEICIQINITKNNFIKRF